MTLSALIPSNALTLLADTRWFRPGASTTAHHVDNLFYVISTISTIFFVLIVALMLLFMWRYRKREGHREQNSPHHNNALEITWSVIPLILAVWIFFLGFTGFMDMRNPPADAYVVNVVAKKWSWTFIYPNGLVHSELHVPVDTPVKLILSSDDVIHSLYIPAFRVKMDCVPGRYTTMWFEANKPSSEVVDPTFDNDLVTGNAYSDDDPKAGYDIYCTEYCGTGHSSMLSKCVVHEPGMFEKWMAKAMDPRSQGSPIEVGETLYKRRGCSQCHKIDGTDQPGNGGPALDKYYGQTVEFTDGSSATIDENYIRESVLNPQAKIRNGYRPIMPTYQGQLKNDEIFALIQYIKSLNDAGPTAWPALEETENPEAQDAETAPAATDQYPTESQPPETERPEERPSEKENVEDTGSDEP